MFFPAHADDTKVLWLSPNDPYFVTEEIVKGTKSAIPQKAIKALQKQLALRLQDYKRNPKCDFAVIGSIEGWPGQKTDTQPFKEKLQSSQVVLIGKVINITPGWNLVFGYVTSLVSLKVINVLKCPIDQCGPDDILMYHQNAGVMTVDSMTLCTENKPYAEATKGQQFLIGGAFDPENRGVLGASDDLILPIANENVIFPLRPDNTKPTIPIDTVLEWFKEKKQTDLN